jgi:hypothetical protein
MQLVSTAFIVTVEKDDFGPDFVLRPGVEIFSASEANEMFLKPAPLCCANVLLFGADRHPAMTSHTVEDGRGGQKTISIGNVSHRLRGENTRREIL